MRGLGCGLGCWLAMAMMGVGNAGAQGVATPVPQLDLKEFVGKWYELERLPVKAEKDCVADALVLFTLRNKPRHFAVVNSCRTKDELDTGRNFVGWMDGSAGDGRLKVRYTWPFSHPYLVLGLGQNYAWALVGSPDHKQLKILSRTPTLPAETVAEARTRAAGQGFDVSKMVTSSQAGQRTITVPKAVAQTSP